MLLGQSKHPMEKEHFGSLKKTCHAAVIKHNDQVVLVEIKCNPHYVQFVFLDCEQSFLFFTRYMELTLRLSVLIVEPSF